MHTAWGNYALKLLLFFYIVLVNLIKFTRLPILLHRLTRLINAYIVKNKEEIIIMIADTIKFHKWNESSNLVIILWKKNGYYSRKLAQIGVEGKQLNIYTHNHNSWCDTVHFFSTLIINYNKTHNRPLNILSPAIFSNFLFSHRLTISGKLLGAHNLLLLITSFVEINYLFPAFMYCVTYWAGWYGSFSPTDAIFSMGHLIFRS